MCVFNLVSLQFRPFVHSDSVRAAQSLRFVRSAERMGERGRSPPTRRASRSARASSASLRPLRRHALSLADAAVLQRAGRGQRRLHVPGTSGFRRRLEPERAHPAAERGLERPESSQEPVQPATTAVESAAAAVAAEWTATAAAVEQQRSVAAAAVAAARGRQQLQGVRLQAANGRPPAAPAEQLCQAGRRTHGCRRTGTLLYIHLNIIII